MQIHKHPEINHLPNLFMLISPADEHLVATSVQQAHTLDPVTFICIGFNADPDPAF